MAQYVQSNHEEPMLFRSCQKIAHEGAINEGSLWLRSSHYYRGLENDIVRMDGSEGVNFTPHRFPLKFDSRHTLVSTISGDGSIGCEIIACYILSMHGTGIREDIRRGFGEYMFGIKSIYKLVHDVLYQAQKQVNVIAHRYGQVSYQYTPLTLSRNRNSASITLSKNLFLKSQNTDILRKAPIAPFIYQDEWRIALFVNEYINNDEAEILKINVNSENFYDYTV